MAEIGQLADDVDEGSPEAVVVDLALSGGFDHVGREAAAKYRGAGVPLTLSRGDTIVRIYPDGREEVLERLPTVVYQLPAGVRILGLK